jgi:hypothetical protein
MNPFTPELKAAFPQYFTVFVGQLFRTPIQISVEVHDFFRVITSFVYACQWFVAALVGIDIQAAVCLFDAYFAQAVLGVVVVVLGCADGIAFETVDDFGTAAGSKVYIADVVE